MGNFGRHYSRSCNVYQVHFGFLFIIWYGVCGSVKEENYIDTERLTGLGDYINIAKTEWITLFNDESLKKTSSNYWQVKKDGGKFDYMAGATITPRAVIKAVYKTLQYFKMNKEALFVATPIIEKETQEATQNGPV